MSEFMPETPSRKFQYLDSGKGGFSHDTSFPMNWPMVGPEGSHIGSRPGVISNLRIASHGGRSVLAD